MRAPRCLFELVGAGRRTSRRPGDAHPMGNAAFALAPDAQPRQTLLDDRTPSDRLEWPWTLREGVPGRARVFRVRGLARVGSGTWRMCMTPRRATSWSKRFGQMKLSRCDPKSLLVVATTFCGLSISVA